MAVDAGDDFSSYLFNISTREIEYLLKKGALSGFNQLAGMIREARGGTVEGQDEYLDDTYETNLDREYFMEQLKDDFSDFDDPADVAEKVDRFMAEFSERVEAQGLGVRVLSGTTDAGEHIISIETRAPSEEVARNAFAKALDDLAIADEQVEIEVDLPLMMAVSEVLPERKIDIDATAALTEEGTLNLALSHLDGQRVVEAADAAAARVLEDDLVAFRINDDVCEELLRRGRIRRPARGNESTSSRSTSNYTPGDKAPNRAMSDIDGSCPEVLIVTESSTKPLPQSVVYIKARESGHLVADLRKLGAQSLEKPRSIARSAGDIPNDIDALAVSSARIAKQISELVSAHPELGPQVK